MVELERPSPGANEVLVRVVASTITAADWRARSLEMPPGFGFFGRLAFGVFGPRAKVLGMEFAGVVEAVGEKVTSFTKGERVFGSTGMRMGCHAELALVAADGSIARMPTRLSFPQAASLSFGGSTALHFLEQAAVKAGERVLVVGASGCVGSACVQLARHLGAEVTGVCSGRNVELVRSFGAAHVIDYENEDFTRGTTTWDVIIDTTGTVGFETCAHTLAPGGRLVLVLASLGQMAKAAFQGDKTGKRVVTGTASETGETMRRLAALAEQGAFTPHVDRAWPLSDVVEAHRYVDTGRKRGSVVIEVAPPPQA